jgi:hypothetical protein
MNIPGFSAETSLYKTSRHYRVSGKFDQADGDIYPALSINDILKSSINYIDVVAKSSRDFSDFIYVNNPFPLIACGALGKACCRAPTASQNVPAFGPLVSCQHGLGCDITTNRCVSTCGGPGQVCCDGPETRAPKWTPDGKLYSPNPRNLREMCDAGVCDRQTHRCITCGTRDGGACCSSDAAQATARCFRDARTGNRLDCHARWVGDVGGICLECGPLGQPACATAGEWPCDDGGVAKNGLCVHCGWVGESICDRGEACRDGRSVPDRSSSLCIAAGGPNQPCRPDGGCDDPRYFCNGNRICQYYNYTIPVGAGASVGGGGGGVCGAKGQVPCGSGCNQGLILSGGKCVSPPSPSPDACALEGQACVADWLTGTHCCQAGGPLLCVYQHCKACIPHGEEVLPWPSPQICCSLGEVPVWDQFSEKAVCGIVSPPEK